MLMERFPARHLRLVAFALVFACALAFSPVASAQEAPKPTLAFSGDVGLVLLYVKAEATTSFEEMLTKFKDGVAKMEAPEVKQMAAGLKFLKAPEGPAPAGATLYILMADPAVKDVEYWFLSLLYKMYPAEAKALFDQWTAAKHATPPVIFKNLVVAVKMQ